MNTQPNTRAWPIGLRRLAEVIGPAGAMAMAEVYGGQPSLYIPKKLTARHDLVLLLGQSNAAKLSKAFGGQRIEIPRGVFINSLKSQILSAQGSKSQIAAQCRCSVRYVRVTLNAVCDQNQTDLFD